MAPAMKSFHLIVSALAVPLAAGYLVPPPGTAAAGTTEQCSKWVQYSPDMTCESILSQHGMTEDQLMDWNPALGKKGNTCTLARGFSYCVQTNHQDPLAASTTLNTVTTSPEATGTTTTNLPATTTSGGNGITTPTPYQEGMVDNCNDFHMVVKGDGCVDIAKEAGIAVEKFYEWNPNVGKSCGKLWLDYNVCIGVVGGDTNPPTTTTSSPPGNGVETPTPHQTGMASNCDTFHLVKDGDECGTIAKKAGITLKKFYNWNPAVGKDCSNLWLDNNVCIGVIGKLRARAATTGSDDGTSIPDPDQGDIPPNCDSFYIVHAGDRCVTIASQEGISLADLIAWNPSVGPDCSNLWVADKLCVGVS